MSMVAFPFKAEPAEVALANLETAARHPAISRVLAVGAEENQLFAHLRRHSTGFDTPVDVVVQERIGSRRPGKGDGMNTALRRFLETDLERLHFYDADITNFDDSWIDGAERAADSGYPIVRHFFSRASTDAMITWMITRPLFAIGHPDTVLWRIRQPLGGELLLRRDVVEELVTDELVGSRSDWGIDTVLTYATARSGRPIYEHHVASGKQHTLYGSLDELRQMAYECFEAATEISRLPPPPSLRHRVEPECPAPPAIAHRVGYDVESTLGLLTAAWSPAEEEAAAKLPPHLGGPLLANRSGISFAFLDADRWLEMLVALRDLYRPEAGWRDLLFRAWVARVLAYTATDALAGHARAMELLESTVHGYAAWAGGAQATDSKATAATPSPSPRP
ncbi:MAG: mannosylglycerate synthase domain-containing protein [Actinomycetota bacterium]